MIVKNLSRKSGSGQLVRYIFKYIFKDGELMDKELSTEYAKALDALGIQYTEKDIHHLLAERDDALLRDDMKAKGLYDNPELYIQKYLLNSQTLNKPALLDGEQTHPPFIIRHNIRSNSINGFIREFEQNEAARLYKRVDQTSIHHTILSWSNKDKEQVTEDMLRDIANQYIQLRGENNLYAGTVHTDREHIHLHIAMSGTQLNGRSSRITKQEFQNIKVKLQEYQKDKYPQLSNSLPNHEKSRTVGRGILKNIKPERSYDKQALLQCLDTIYSKALSQEHFLSELKHLGHEPYYRNGRFQGIRFNGERKFRINRLGYDKKKLNELDQRLLKEEKELAELNDLRTGKSQELDRDDDERDIADTLDDLDDEPEDDQDDTEDMDNPVNDEPEDDYDPIEYDDEPNEN